MPVRTARGRAARLAIGLAALAFAAGCATRSVESPPSGIRSFIRAPESLDNDQRERFGAGRALFGKRWTEAEGLGPLFDGKSCLVCHPRGGGGKPPGSDDASAENASAVVRLSGDSTGYGDQLQRRAVGGQAGEGRLSVTFTERAFQFPDGEVVSLREPHYALTDPAHGPFPRNFSVLIAPRLAGAGLLEAIPDASIAAGADPSDKDGDGISGRIAWTGDGRIGRFGWRAQAATIPAHVARALALDMGLSSSLHPFPQGDCAGPCGAASQVEVGDDRFDLLVAFTRMLPPPPRRPDLGTHKGERLFAAVGCAACHRPAFDVPAGRVPWPAQAPILPYTDLLLHDMGPGLGDAESREWRTAPLWGVARRREVQGDEFYLHDGRARSLVEAVLWHGGEAEGAVAAFVALSPAERGALLAFIGSL